MCAAGAIAQTGPLRRSVGVRPVPRSCWTSLPPSHGVDVVMTVGWSKLLCHACVSEADSRSWYIRLLLALFPHKENPQDAGNSQGLIAPMDCPRSCILHAL